mgnify:CR=1 FL=1
MTVHFRLAIRTGCLQAPAQRREGKKKGLYKLGEGDLGSVGLNIRQIMENTLRSKAVMVVLGLFLDVGHLHQLLRRSGQHCLQAAEPLDEGVGDGVGVPLGDGVIEQQLQQFVVGKGFRPAPEELLAFSVSVAIVDAHWLLSVYRDIYQSQMGDLA